MPHRWYYLSPLFTGYGYKLKDCIKAKQITVNVSKWYNWRELGHKSAGNINKHGSRG